MGRRRRNRGRKGTGDRERGRMRGGRRDGKFEELEGKWNSE